MRISRIQHSLAAAVVRFEWRRASHVVKKHVQAFAAPPSMSREDKPPGALPTATAPPKQVDATASSLSLDHLMNRYASGDASAFAPLYELLAPRLYTFLLRLSGRSHIAQDLLQEAFLRIHRARGTFSGGSALLPWSYAIARHVFIDFARHSKVRGTPTNSAAATTTSLPIPDETSLPATADTAPDARLHAQQTLDLVNRTLAELPLTQREAFVLLRFEGLTVAEAAQILDTTEGNVKVRAHRAYEALRAALRDTGE